MDSSRSRSGTSLKLRMNQGSGPAFECPPLPLVVLEKSQVCHHVIAHKALLDMVQREIRGHAANFYPYALHEAAFTQGWAKFIVYGHTHHYELVPLQSVPVHKSGSRRSALGQR